MLGPLNKVMSRLCVKLHLGRQRHDITAMKMYARGLSGKGEFLPGGTVLSDYHIPTFSLPDCIKH